MNGAREQMLNRMKYLVTEGFGRIWALPDEPFSFVKGDEWMTREVTLMVGDNPSPLPACLLDWKPDQRFAITQDDWKWAKGMFHSWKLAEQSKRRRN